MQKLIEDIVKAAEHGKELVLRTRVDEKVARRSENGYQSAIDACFELTIPEIGLLHRIPLLSESSQGCAIEAETYMNTIKELLSVKGYVLKGNKIVKNPYGSKGH